MTLRKMQSIFILNTAKLINKAYDLGYELTYGEAYRSPEEAERLAKLGKGIKDSLHGYRLALDINLFKNGVYLTSTASHALLGEYWKSLHPLNAWGGDFKDGNHYSMSYRGKK